MSNLRLLRALPRGRSTLTPSPKRTFTTTPIHNKHLGFIGLGQMGHPMALNLLRTLTSPEDTLTIFDVSPPAITSFLHAAKTLPHSPDENKNGNAPPKGRLVEAASVEEVWDNAEEIITMLPRPEHVWGVYERFAKRDGEGKGGRGKLLLDSSTIDIPTCSDIATKLFPKDNAGGHVFLDAPVSGGVAAATKGTLTFMLGIPPLPPTTTTTSSSGDPLPALHTRIQSLLAPLSSTLHPCGPPSTGLAAKLTNNYLLSISNIGVCEAMNLGVKLGLTPTILSSVINTSSGACWASKVNNPLDRIPREAGGAGKGWEVGFKTELMRKDLRLAREAAGKVGARLVLADRAEEVYRDVEEERGGEGLLAKKEGTRGRDFSVVYRWLGGKE